jgi:hypothetical protein
MTEFDIQKAVVGHLQARARPNVFWCSIPNNPRSKVSGARLKAAGMRSGAPDLLLVLSGRAYGLELKTDRGRQSPAQKEVETQWEDAGGDYFVARGLDEALDILELIGALRGAP